MKRVFVKSSLFFIITLVILLVVVSFYDKSVSLTPAKSKSSGTYQVSKVSLNRAHLIEHNRLSNPVISYQNPDGVRIPLLNEYFPTTLYPVLDNNNQLYIYGVSYPNGYYADSNISIGQLRNGVWQKSDYFDNNYKRVSHAKLLFTSSNVPVLVFVVEKYMLNEKVEKSLIMATFVGQGRGNCLSNSWKCNELRKDVLSSNINSPYQNTVIHGAIMAHGSTNDNIHILYTVYGYAQQINDADFLTTYLYEFDPMATSQPGTPDIIFNYVGSRMSRNEPVILDFKVINTGVTSGNPFATYILYKQGADPSYNLLTNNPVYTSSLPNCPIYGGTQRYVCSLVTAGEDFLHGVISSYTTADSSTQGAIVYFLMNNVLNNLEGHLELYSMSDKDIFNLNSATNTGVKLIYYRMYHSLSGAVLQSGNSNGKIQFSATTYLDDSEYPPFEYSATDHDLITYVGSGGNCGNNNAWKCDDTGLGGVDDFRRYGIITYAQA